MDIDIRREIESCQKVIADLEFNLAVQKAVLSRLIALVERSGAPREITGLSTARAARDRTTDTVRPGSLADKARGILRQTGTPMHVADITEALVKAGEKATGKTPLKVLTVSALIRSNAFTKLGKGRYGLAEWADKAAEK